MSWSFSAIGKPAKVAEAIQARSAELSGQSRIEFDDAKPHLAALVKQNFAVEGMGHSEPLVKIEASGSGSAVDSMQRQRSCTVKLETFYAQLLV